METLIAILIIIILVLIIIIVNKIREIHEYEDTASTNREELTKLKNEISDLNKKYKDEKEASTEEQENPFCTDDSYKRDLSLAKEEQAKLCDIIVSDKIHIDSLDLKYKDALDKNKECKILIEKTKNECDDFIKNIKNEYYNKLKFIESRSVLFDKIVVSNTFDILFKHIPIEDLLSRILKSGMIPEENIRDIKFYAIATFTGSNGEVYETRLDRCSCPSFTEVNNKQPCKHMYRLSEELQLFSYMLPFTSDTYKRILSKIDMRITKCDELESQKRAEIKLLDEQKNKVLSDIDKQKKELKNIQNIIEEKTQTFPWLVDFIARYKQARIDSRVRDKFDKRRFMSEISSLTRTVEELRNQIAVYEYTFPILEEYKTLPPSEMDKNIAKGADNTDSYKWLSDDEYDVLTSAQKCDLWLDKYFSCTSRNAWEAGIKYERYIGYLCESRGYNVKYTGALLKLEDMGRDLIVSKGKKVYIIQCKRYKETSQIHENSLFQLFCSITHYASENPKIHAVGVFVTTSELSPIAKECAEKLGLTLYEHCKFDKYPLIKCNMSKDGEKIYHLPFDQQYDKIIIESNKGECYAPTIEAAEKLGYRHAFRHYQ